MVTNIYVLYRLVIKLFHIIAHAVCQQSTWDAFLLLRTLLQYIYIYKIIILLMPACICVAPLYDFVLYISVSNVAERASNTQTTYVAHSNSH